MSNLGMQQDMTGKVILVTGGARGMGREAALMLGQLGARVIIADWEGEAGTRARDQINAAGPGSVYDVGFRLVMETK